MKSFLILSAVSALAFAVQADAADLTVEITNAKSADGFVGAALYRGEAGWLKDGSAVASLRAQAGDKVVLVFRGLEPGLYALSAMHDENGSGKLDRNLVGLPTERYGFSRGARGAFGPPAFDAAAFELTGDTALTLTLE